MAVENRNDIADKAQEVADMEEGALQRHQSSFSTLGQLTSSFRSTDATNDMELVETGSTGHLASAAAAIATTVHSDEAKEDKPVVSKMSECVCVCE